MWRTGYYTFLNTHIGHAGAHHLNEVILVFLIRLIINYLDVNCFAVDGKIKYHKQGAESGQGSWRREGERKRPKKVPVGPNSTRAWRKVLSWPPSCLRESPRVSCGCMLQPYLKTPSKLGLYSQRFQVPIPEMLCDLGQIVKPI